MSSEASEIKNANRSIGTSGVAGIPSSSRRQAQSGLKTRLHTLVALSIAVGLLVIALPRLPTPRSASRTSDELTQKLLSFGVPASSFSIPSTYTTRSDYLSASAPREHRIPDTTAVILNWSRLENVLLISALLCGPWLDDTIAQLFIWNNNPNITLSYKTFKPTGCPTRKLRIYNSPSNMLFQARYLACVRARTAYCFTQDDDYLVQPEVIKNLHFYMTENPSSSSMHLLPAHEHLLSRLRTFIHQDQSITTAFAWLGHGAYFGRASAREFLSLLQELNITNDEIKMADNYFTILANRPKIGEIWFDHGIELGGGQPFTVGSEGDDRNDRHTARALEYLALLMSSSHPASQHSYVSKAASSNGLVQVNFAPCRLDSCVLSSNIMLLSPDAVPKFQSLSIESVSRRKLQNSDADDRNWYIQHPLSNIVDARPNSTFHSPQPARVGEWIILDGLGALGPRDYHDLELAFLVDGSTEDLFRQDCSFSVSLDGIEWINVENALNCVTIDETPEVRECSVKMERIARYFRAMITGSSGKPRRWIVHEMWLRYSRGLELNCA